MRLWAQKQLVAFVVQQTAGVGTDAVGIAVEGIGTGLAGLLMSGSEAGRRRPSTEMKDHTMRMLKRRWCTVKKREAW